MNTIHIVTVVEEYTLVNQFAFTSREKAYEKHTELLKECYIDAVNEAKEDYGEELNIEDYQFTEAWWDNDTRISIHIEEITVEN